MGWCQGGAVDLSLSRGHGVHTQKSYLARAPAHNPWQVPVRAEQAERGDS